MSREGDPTARTVDRVRRVPDRYRDFSVSEPAVTAVYGIPEGMLQELLAEGFPHAEHGGRRTFDRQDLRNALLVMAPDSAQLTSLTAIADSLRRAQAGRTFVGSVEVIGKCPHRDVHACSFTFQRGLTTWPGAVLVAPHHLRAQVTLSGSTEQHALPGAVLELFDELRSLEFMHLPAVLARDHSFLAEHRLADCRLAGAHALRRGAEAGVAVRSATGLVVSTPFSVWHQWFEVELAGRWVAFDPFFVSALEGWGALAPEECSSYRSVEGAYWRLAERDEYLMRDDGVGIVPVLYTAEA